MGRIARPFGIKGELKLILESDSEDRLEGIGELMIAAADDCRVLKLVESTPMAGWYRIKLEGVNDADTAGSFAGADVIIPESERPALSQNSFYADQIIGCRAVSDGGEELGWVREIIPQGHHDLWAVDGPLGEILVPAVAFYVLKVDMTKHEITVRRVDGLWDED